jgi:hypothetical protein
MSDGQERRRYRRIENPYITRFRIKPDKIQKMVPTNWDLIVEKNLSAGGTSFYTKKDLGIGTLLGLKIDIPKSTPTINCIGKIIRSDQLKPTSVFCIAIKFIDIGEKEKEMINTTIEELLE